MKMIYCYPKHSIYPYVEPPRFIAGFPLSFHPHSNASNHNFSRRNPMELKRNPACFCKSRGLPAKEKLSLLRLQATILSMRKTPSRCFGWCYPCFKSSSSSYERWKGRNDNRIEKLALARLRLARMLKRV